MLLLCVGSGSALNIVEKVRTDNHDVACGYTAYKALQSWFLDPSQKSKMLKHYDGKLNALVLDTNTTATDFIKTF